jgi:micrococcal nuclease
MRTALTSFLLGVLATALLGATPMAKPLHFPPREGAYRIAVYKVIDGDSFHFFWVIPDVARLHGVNAPETKGETKVAGLAARDWLANLLASEPEIKAHDMLVEVKGKEKYGRALLRLHTADGKDVSEEMIKAGHAKPYDP